jgi:hypothetical protein
MADDEFDDEPDLDEDEPELEEDDDLALDEDDETETEDLDELEGVEDLAAAPKRGVVKGDEDESSEDDDGDVVDLEEELHPDDVEEPLDVLLAERTASATLEDEDTEEVEDDEGEADDRVDGSARIVPRREDEFLCRSCFLVLPRTQLARGEQDLCRDCA